MSKTIENKAEVKNNSLGELKAIPVASGEIIYQGTLAAVGNDGLLYNLDSSAIPGARSVALVSDQSANVDGPAATTSAGAISAAGRGSEDAGDKTVRLCYTQAIVKMVASSIGQDDLFQTMYASDNFTMDESPIAGMPIGSLVVYESSTVGWVEINTFYKQDGTITYKGSILDVTTTSGGDIISWANPTGETIMVTDLIIDITTPATGAANADIGIAADGTTTDADIYDEIDIGTAAILVNATTGNGGTDGKLARKMTSTEYITGTPSASAADIVGTFEVNYKIWK
jgi:hypothetical protein